MNTVRELYDFFIDFIEIGGDMQARIKEKGLYDIFLPLTEVFDDDEYSFNKTFFYILLLYTKDGDVAIDDIGWDEKRALACRMVNLNLDEPKDADLYYKLLFFQLPAVTLCIQSWLFFQGSSIFTHIRVLQDSYSDFLIGARFSTKTDGKPDYDMRKKCIDYAGQVYKEINEWEQRYKEEFKPLLNGLKELKQKGGINVGDKRNLNYEKTLREHKIRNAEKRENNKDASKDGDSGGGLDEPAVAQKPLEDSV